MASARTDVATTTGVVTRVEGSLWSRIRTWLRQPDTELALLCTSLALGLGCFSLGQPSIWMDEAFSVALARAPFAVLGGAFTGGEPNMALYHSLLHFWLEVCGWLGLPASEFVVRLPSALCFGLSAPVVFLLGRQLLGRFGGCTAALLFALNPLALTYAQQARSYALQVLLVCLAWYALVMATTGKRRRLDWWILFTVVSVCAIYAHAFSLLVVLAQATAYGLLLFLPTPWRVDARQRIVAMTFSLGSVLILAAPLLYVSRSGSKTGWLPAPNVESLVSHYAQVIAGRGGKAAALALLGAALVAVAVFASTRWPGTRAMFQRELSSLARGRAAAKRPEAATPVLVVLVAWLAVPVVVSFVISQGPTRLFSSRYLVVVAPAVSLLLGFAVTVIRQYVLQLAAAATILCVALFLVPSYYAHAESENWRGPTRWLERHFQPGDGLVCYNNVQGCQIAVEYYLVTDRSAATFTADSPGVVHLERYGHGDPFAGFDTALETAALARFSASHPHVFYIAGRFTDARDKARAEAVEAWLDCRYHLIGQTSSAVVTIRLYDTVPSSTACAPPN